MTNANALITLEDAEKLPISEIVAYGRRAGIIPKEVASDEAAYGVILKARELGIPPMAAFGEIHVIEGKPTCSAKLHLALARRLMGERLVYEIKGDTEKCWGRMSTDGGQRWQEITITFKEMEAAGYTHTWKDGKRVVKKNWLNSGAMLRARVQAALVRLCVPEAALGIYTREEMEDVRDLKSIPHAETTTAQRLQEQLLGKPTDAPSGGPPPAEPVALPEGQVIDVESGEPEPEVPSTADWETAIDQAESPESIATSLREIAKDERLTKEQKLALKERAVKVSKSKGFKKPRAPGQEG